MNTIQRIEGARGHLRILIYLLHNNTGNASDFDRNLNLNKSTITTAINKLKNAGLVNVDQLTRFPFSKNVTITKKGRRVAEKLMEIEKILD